MEKRKLTESLKIFLALLGLLVTCLLSFACFGAGRQIVVEQTYPELSYDDAYEKALKSAEEMCQEAKKVNPYNFPVIVKIGTSKSRNIITVSYQYDPVAGSVGTKPPETGEIVAKSFVPHFGAEFYLHIKLIKQADKARGVKVTVTQMKGVKKDVFDQEMENLKSYYLSFLSKYWSEKAR